MSRATSCISTQASREDSKSSAPWYFTSPGVAALADIAVLTLAVDEIFLPLVPVTLTSVVAILGFGITRCWGEMEGELEGAGMNHMKTRRNVYPDAPGV